MLQHIKVKSENDSVGRVSKSELIGGIRHEPEEKMDSDSREKIKWARLSVISNSVLLVLKLAIGILIMSVSVISEGLHTGIDLLAALMAAYAVHKAAQPADKDHKYGHGKYENFSGTLEAILIFAVALVIFYEAGLRIFEWRRDGVTPLVVDYGIVIMLISTFVNFAVSRKLHSIAEKHDSIALEADAYHLSADVWTSLGVFIGLVLIKAGQFFSVPNIEYLDPVIAMVVAVIIFKAAIDLTRRSMKDLLDSSLPDDEERVIRETIEKHGKNFVDYHKLRSRKAGAERHIDLHVVVSRENTIEQAHAICHQIEDEIKKRLKHSHVIIHCEPCRDECASCKLEKKTNGECVEKNNASAPKKPGKQ